MKALFTHALLVLVIPLMNCGGTWIVVTAVQQVANILDGAKAVMKVKA